MSMLIHAMDQPPTRFLLREFVSGQLLQVPDNLPKYFRIDDRSVMNFATLSSGRIAPSFKHMIAVMGENYYTCWHKHEGRLMRFGAEDGRFMSILPFEVYNVSCQHICAVAMSPSESALLIGTKAGAIYFLHSDIANRAMYLKSTFCHHTNPISKFAIDHRSSRAISFTTDLNDIPRVWLLQRHYAGLLHPLNTLGAFPHDLKDEDKIVVDACINSLNYHAIVITNRCLAVFDDNGDVFGVGSLANPRKMEGSIMLEDDDGEIGVAVEGASSMFVSNLTAVEAYQTREWASGMSLFLTGHKDGSLSLWRMTRLPPDTVQPGRIAVVEFHGVIQDNKSSSPISGSVTCIKQEKPDIPLFFIGYSNGASRVLEFTPPQLVSEEKGKSGEKKK
ncbi:hypothetical protein, conserved [Angomonas deanei]|uniref:WD domain, G-beta repeat n=1 Tax=Angomonas deanei TaxID=59799 RepID=A0A7G2CR04_9TRYP|nr:hypothetical protein, conserved [Angomonas deanei]